jgi:GntR family transcriptional regulator
MLIVVDPHSGVPVYRQLMDQIRFLAASGRLAPGDELPSTRALSAELGINPMTISKAYGLLEREGVIGRRPGRPLVVCAVEGDRARGRKLDRLREALAPTVTMARQLGVAPADALRAFAEMLHEPEAAETRSAEAEPRDRDATGPSF